MILDIKTLATLIIDDVKEAVSHKEVQPSLTIILVGNNSASEVYVKNKIKTCEAVGIRGILLTFPDTITQEILEEEIHQLNDDTTVDGILVQSPLPGHIEAQRVFDCINPQKDVDGFSQTNIAKLYSGDTSGLVPGTPKGVMKIITEYFQPNGNLTPIPSPAQTSPQPSPKERERLIGETEGSLINPDFTPSPVRGGLGRGSEETEVLA